MQPGALEDFELSRAGLSDCRRHFRALIGAIGEDRLDEPGQPPRPPRQRVDAVVLPPGDVQDETERVEENVPLAAPDFLPLSRQLIRGLSSLRPAPIFSKEGTGPSKCAHEGEPIRNDTANAVRRFPNPFGCHVRPEWFCFRPTSRHRADSISVLAKPVPT